MSNLFTFTTIVFVALSNSQDDVEIPMDRSLLFNEELAERFESEFEEQSAKTQKALLHKIGVLGVFFRVHKVIVPTPGQGTGYMHRFPEPVPKLDEKLSKSCENSFKECIAEIFSVVRSSHPWLYPTGSREQSETELSTAVLKDDISDNMLGTEVTATQFLCFFTLRRIPAFEQIPFCRFRLKQDSGNDEKMLWPGYIVQSSPQMVDEYLGDPYQCALESFCPDPCCHGIPTSSEAFLSRTCRQNKCAHRDRCQIEPEFNDDFPAIRKNEWNVTCPCGKGLMYRSDVETCVHTDLCTDENRCPEPLECVNTITNPGYKCVCQLGYIFDKWSGRCVPIKMSTADWHGFAFSEPHPKLSSIPGFLTLLLVSMIILLL
ncbi:hypothetical protein Q1695_005472 [Nippostrongylus brasiliensis]|nr:hypothetical protein Q1695_005472 [Nippostrongylus brasiliensis]